MVRRARGWRLSFVLRHFCAHRELTVSLVCSSTEIRGSALSDSADGAAAAGGVGRASWPDELDRPRAGATGEAAGSPARQGRRPLPAGLVGRWWCDASVTALAVSTGMIPRGITHEQRTRTAVERRASKIQHGNGCSGLRCCGRHDPLVTLVPHHVRSWAELGKRRWRRRSGPARASTTPSLAVGRCPSGTAGGSTSTAGLNHRPSWTTDDAGRWCALIPERGPLPLAESHGSRRRSSHWARRPIQPRVLGYGVGGFSGLVPPAQVPWPASPGDPWLCGV